MQALEKFQPGASGVAFAYMTQSEEDTIFSDNAVATMWKQEFERFMPSKFANINYAFTNSGAGKRGETTLLRSVDYLSSSMTITYAPALAPRVENGVTECSYVNALGFALLNNIQFRISTQNLYTMEGFVMFVLCDLLGLLEEYAEMIGYCKTKTQLIAQSKTSRYIATPLIGFPFQNGPDSAFACCGVNYFPINCVVNVRGLNDLFINYSDLAETPNAVPRNLISGEILTKDDINMILSSKNVWCTKPERDSMATNYNETIFPEFRVVGHADVSSGPDGQKVPFAIDMKGPVNFVILIAQEKQNIDSGNWTNFASSDGSDIVQQFNIITGNTARQDSLPGVVQRLKCVELFGQRSTGCVYLLEFCNNGRTISGHQSFTNIDKQSCVVYLNKHADVHLTLIAGEYNAIWSELGNSGRVWA